MVTRRGVALQIVIVLVAIVLFLASAMVALTTMNLNLTQGYSNGEIALSEAEAAAATLLYNLSESDDYGVDGTASFRGRLTPGYDDSQCWHAVTFGASNSQGLPWSVNNKDGSKSAGYLSRTVPTRMVHAFAVGYCRGQTRTIELLVERPPFPYAIANSGPIRSSRPLTVYGTSSASRLIAGGRDRPGHVASNYRGRGQDDPSIRIGRDDANPNNQTYISGFVQAVGLVDILQPAVVRHGVRRGGDGVKLPDIPIASFRNAGQPGVIEIRPERIGSQSMDAMYHSGHNLTCDGGFTLHNAFLYVDGDLTVNGPVKGTGAIVVNGNVRVTGDTDLAGTNKVALVASKDIRLDGAGNYFQGILYARGNVQAKNITVVGNMVINSPDPAGGRAVLDRVQMVSDLNVGRIEFTARSSTDATDQYNGPSYPFSLVGNKIGADADEGGDFMFRPAATVRDAIVQGIDADTLTFGDYMDVAREDPAIQAILADIAQLQAEMASYRELGAQIAALESRLAGMDSNDPECGAVEGEIANKRTQRDALKVAMEAAAWKIGVDAEKYYKSHSDRSGRYNTGNKNIDVARRITVDLNQFLPTHQSLKVRYWHVFNRAL